MDLGAAINRRRMVRRYQPGREVPADVVDRLLEHAVQAPSAGFSQGWDFVVLRAEADRMAFWAATAPDDDPPGRWLRGLMTAPLLLLCLSDKNAYLDRYAQPDKGWTDRDEGRWPVPYWDVDTGMAALLMLLTAVDNGLGGCFFGVPRSGHDALRAVFAIPGDRRFVGVVSVGYPARGPRSPGQPSPGRRPGRRPVREVAHDGRFGVPYPGAGPAREPGTGDRG
jgi:nitroreductase